MLVVLTAKKLLRERDPAKAEFPSWRRCMRFLKQSDAADPEVAEGRSLEEVPFSSNSLNKNRPGRFLRAE